MSGSQPNAEAGATPTNDASSGMAAADTSPPPASQASASNDQGATAGSPPANEHKAAENIQAETREGLLAATRAALEATDDAGTESAAKDEAAEGTKPREAADESKAGGEAPEKPKDGADDADKGAGKDEEDPPFHQHPRWQKMVAERNELRGEIETMRPLAERQTAILEYMDRNELTPDEVGQGFAIMAALKSDPAAAWDLMRPYVESVQAHLGNHLPDDLREKVESGLVDEDTARETARLRSERQFQASRAERAAARSTEQRTNAQDVAAAQARVSAVDAWFSAQAADPDYAAVEPLLTGEILRLQHVWGGQGKDFSTPDGAVALSKAAYENVRKHLAPRRAPIRSTPGSPPPTAPPTNSGAQPGNMIDAMRAALAAAG